MLKQLRSWWRKRTEVHRCRRAPVVLPVRGAVRGRVLLAYIAGPLRGRLTGMHSNEQEVLAMAEELLALGMQVEALDYDSAWRCDPSRWDLVLGFGGLFEEACREGRPGQHRVLYHTGAYLPFQNAAEMARVDDFQRRHAVRLRPRRLVGDYGPASQHLADAIILVGNAWTASTYPAVRPLSTIDPTCNAHWRGLRPGPASRRRGILWAGGNGCLHKGLDLVLDAMPALPASWRLHICGDSDEAEPDFWAHYSSLPDSVHRHGWLHPASPRMREVLDDCAFIILPSCCEGMATSVLAGMACGLVPVVTRETGIDGVGLRIAGLSVEAVGAALREAAGLGDDEVATLAEAARARICERHELPAFRRRFRELVGPFLPAGG